MHLDPSLTANVCGGWGMCMYARMLQDRPRDYYHTCYSLSGLSLAQHGLDPDGDSSSSSSSSSSSTEPLIVGPKQNLLERTDPLHNVSAAKSKQAHAYFSSLPKIGEAGGGTGE
jgi:hypothetical protein